MTEECPECGNALRERAPNFLRNIRRREIDDVYERFVCPACEQTFSHREVVDHRDENISMTKWMNGNNDE